MAKITDYTQSPAAIASNAWVSEYLHEKIIENPHYTRKLLDQIGVSKSAFYSYLAGDRSPKLEVLAAIAEFSGDDFLIIPINKGADNERI